MSTDINELDVNDIGLKGIFGDRFHDETQSKPKTEEKRHPNANTIDNSKLERKAADKSVDAKLEPVKTNTNWLDKLKGSAVWALGFGSLSFLVFSWQQAELMDSSIAIPTMCIFTALAGFGVGKNARCK